MNNRVVILGGGPAGIAAAIEASKYGAKVCLLEKNDRIGRKLLATGNGRCNIYNTLPSKYRGDNDFADNLFAKYPLTELISFFENIGLKTREEEQGRVYPASGYANSVLNALLLALERSKVKTFTKCKASSLNITSPKSKGYFKINTEDCQTFYAEQVIVAGGGMAAPNLGSDGNIYKLLLELGHELISPTPALVPLVSDFKFLKSLTGLRLRATVKILSSNTHPNIFGLSESGEILFTSYGLSGIASMDLGEYFEKGGILSVNFSPAAALNEKAMLEELEKRRESFANFAIEYFFTGMFHKRVGQMFLRAAKIESISDKCSTLTDKQIKSLYQNIVDFRIKISGNRGFKYSQATSGGISTKDFHPHTMESKIIPGIYAAGEVLNVHGPCGGYNLHFAFTSGISAGRASGNK